MPRNIVRPSIVLKVYNHAVPGGGPPPANSPRHLIWPTQLSQTGATPAPEEPVARFIGIITSPQATFESVVAHPKWFGMLALTTLIVVALCAALPMTTEAGQEAGSTAGRPDAVVRACRSATQQYGRCEKIATVAGYIDRRVDARLHADHRCVIIAGILFAVFNAALGGEATFKQVFTVVVHAGVDLGVLGAAVHRCRSTTSAAR